MPIGSGPRPAREWPRLRRRVCARHKERVAMSYDRPALPSKPPCLREPKVINFNLVQITTFKSPQVIAFQYSQCIWFVARNKHW